MIDSIGLRSARSGFSLTDTIIALLIIGIMVAGTFSLFKWINSARYTKTQTILRGVQMDINQFQIHTGSYPRTLTDLVVRPTDATIAKKWHGPYSEEKEGTFAVKDGWNNELQYHINAKGAKHPYELFSWGPKGEESTNEERIDVWEI